MNWKRVIKLSKDEVCSLCRKYSVTLPDDYKSHIGDINGGGLVSASVDVKGLGSVAYTRNVTLSDDIVGNAFALYNTIGGFVKNYFPFGSVGNGDYYCIDLNSDQIVLYQHETQKAYPVCKTFTEFLELIHED